MGLEALNTTELTTVTTQQTRWSLLLPWNWGSRPQAGTGDAASSTMNLNKQSDIDAAIPSQPLNIQAQVAHPQNSSPLTQSTFGRMMEIHLEQKQSHSLPAQPLSTQLKSSLGEGSVLFKGIFLLQYATKVLEETSLLNLVLKATDTLVALAFCGVQIRHAVNKLGETGQAPRSYIFYTCALITSVLVGLHTVAQLAKVYELTGVSKHAVEAAILGLLLVSDAPIEQYTAGAYSSISTKLAPISERVTSLFAKKESSASQPDAGKEKAD